MRIGEIVEIGERVVETPKLRPAPAEPRPAQPAPQRRVKTPA